MSNEKIKILYLYIDQKNGYGLSAQNLIEELMMLNEVEIDIVPLNNPNAIKEKSLLDSYDIGICHISTNSVIQHVNSNGYIKFALSRCQKKYQYFLWETDTIPHQYDEFFKTGYFDGFICPSIFCCDLVKKYGDVHHIPIGFVNEADINYTSDKRISDDSVFRVITVAQNSVRKSIDVSVCAFATAFEGHKDVEYILKIGENVDNQNVENLIKANVSKAMIKTPPSIYTIYNEIDREDMRKLYLSSDCYLHLSRGEGFGMTTLEAINYGLPVIYSNWSAHSEFLSQHDDSIPVEGRLDLVHSMDRNFGFHPGMKWFEPLTCSAVDALRKTYKLWKEKKLSYERAKVCDNYDSDSIKKKIGEFLNVELTAKKTHDIGSMKVVEI